MSNPLALIRLLCAFPRENKALRSGALVRSVELAQK